MNKQINKLATRNGCHFDTVTLVTAGLASDHLRCEHRYLHNPDTIQL